MAGADSVRNDVTRGCRISWLSRSSANHALRHDAKSQSDEALAYAESWLEQPYVTMVGPGEKHWPILRNLLHSSGTAGNLTSDAHIAALALEQGATVYSADNDFKRFIGVGHVNPISG